MFKAYKNIDDVEHRGLIVKRSCLQFSTKGLKQVCQDTNKIPKPHHPPCLIPGNNLTTLELSLGSQIGHRRKGSLHNSFSQSEVDEKSEQTSAFPAKQTSINVSICIVFVFLWLTVLL